MSKQSLRHFPILLFASVMGFAAYTIAIGQLERIYNYQPIASIVLIVLTSGLFLLNGAILFYRLLYYKADVKKDFNHPVKMNFFAMISISLLLLAVLYIDVHYTLSFLFWLCGMILQLLLTLIVLSKMLWESPFDLNLLTPATFIPIVGNLVVPIGGFSYVSDVFNWFFLAVGLFFSIIFMTFVFYRLFFVAPLPSPLLPSLFILLAPPSVAFIAYMTAVQTVDIFAKVLYGIALFFGLFLFIQFIKMIQGSFVLSMWTFLFPTGAFTVATIRMFEKTGENLYHNLAIFLMIFLTALIIYLSWFTLQAWRKGKLAKPDA